MSNLVPELSLQIVALQKALDVSRDEIKQLMKDYEKLSSLCTWQGIRLMEQEDELKEQEDVIKELKQEISRLQCSLDTVISRRGYNGQRN